MSALTAHGMGIQQAINMLVAAQAQGADYVALAVQTKDGPKFFPLEWISPVPVEEYNAKIAYLAAIGSGEDMSNTALQSLDW